VTAVKSAERRRGVEEIRDSEGPMVIAGCIRFSLGICLPRVNYLSTFLNTEEASKLK
jgi:hypothetical protein